MKNSIPTDQLIIEVMETADEDFKCLPPKIKLLLERLLEEREQSTEAEKRFAEEKKQLLERIRILEEGIEVAQEKGKQNSQNSSQPPSQDGPEVPKESKKPKRTRTGKARGGQKGHKKSTQPLFDLSECKEVIEHYPSECACCGSPLDHTHVSAINRHQYVELPEIKLEITEHQVYEVECSHCGKQTSGKLPESLPKSHYGERLCGFIALLRGNYRCSYQKVQDFLKDFLGLSISLGQISRLSREMKEGLAAPVAEALAYVQKQEVVGGDETSFAQKNGDGNNPENRKGWLWVLVTKAVTVFQITLSRSQAVAQELLGAGREKMPIVITDRYGGYNWIPLEFRQICWAHLKRDFQKIVERSGASEEVGANLLHKVERLFRWMHRWRKGLLKYEVLCQAMERLRASTRELLEKTASFVLEKKDKSLWGKTVRTCRQILKIEKALWTFVGRPDVEPTNNTSERALRPAVIWRRITYGSQSQEGSEFVAHMLTVVTSLRQQGRSVFQFLVDVLTAKRQGKKGPSLLPNT